MRFAYQEYRVLPSGSFPEGVLLRPEVPLRVIGPTGHETLLALVDTGADGTVLPSWTQAAIGAVTDERAKSTVAGIAGQELEVVPAEVELAVEQNGEEFRWKAQVDFASSDAIQDVAAILGHAGCLRYFRATFDGHARQLELTPTPDFPGHVSSP